VVAWDGPSFGRNLPYEAICDELCWSPTYSVSSRISGTIDASFVGRNDTFDAARSVIVRVTMEATIFIDAIKQIQIQGHGEAFICTNEGVVVAAVEMADTETADPLTGTVRMVKAWEYLRPWASSIDEARVAVGSGESWFSGDFIVSAWRMESPHNSTSTLGDSLRIVVAVPSSAFADSVLQSMRFWFMVTSALPVAFILIASIVNLYLRFCARGRRDFAHMTIAELKATNRNRRKISSLQRSRTSLWGSEGEEGRGSMRRTLSRTFSREGGMMDGWLVRRQTTSRKSLARGESTGSELGSEQKALEFGSERKALADV